MELPGGFEPSVKDLQSHALPLGYGSSETDYSITNLIRNKLSHLFDYFPKEKSDLIHSFRLYFAILSFLRFFLSFLEV